MTRAYNELSRPFLPNVVELILLYSCAILLSFLMLALPGGRASYYALLAGVCVLFALSSCRAVRIWSVIATLVSISFAIWDHEVGLSFQHKRYRAALQNVQAQREAPAQPQTLQNEPK